MLSYNPPAVLSAPFPKEPEGEFAPYPSPLAMGRDVVHEYSDPRQVFLRIEVSF